MHVSHAQPLPTNKRPILQKHLLNSRQPTLQLRQRPRLQTLQNLRFANDREYRLPILDKRLALRSLRRQKRKHTLERLVPPYFVRLVRGARGDLVRCSQVVEDGGEDCGAVGVDVAADCQERDAAVGYVEGFEVWARENGRLGEFAVSEAREGEEQVDFLAVGGGVVGEEDERGGHGGGVFGGCWG